MGGFRTPAPCCASFSRRRRPEPFTIADIRTGPEAGYADGRGIDGLAGVSPAEIVHTDF
jgi:hypothetical protein